MGELPAAGVRRISLATSLYPRSNGRFLDAINEIKSTGQFSFLDRCITTPEFMNRMGI